MTHKDENILRLGLEAVREKLGRSGLIRFIQRISPGRGNWAKERHAWVDSVTLEDIHRMIAEHRAKNGRSKNSATGKRAAKPKKRRKVA